MNQSTLELQRAKAEQVLRDQVKSISRSQFPSSDFAQGMVEMAYATDLLNDLRLGYWRQAIENAVQVRRQWLRNQKQLALINIPGVICGKLVNQ